MRLSEKERLVALAVLELHGIQGSDASTSLARMEELADDRVDFATFRQRIRSIPKEDLVAVFGADAGRAVLVLRDAGEGLPGVGVAVLRDPGEEPPAPLPVWLQSLDREEALLAARALRTVLDVGAYGWSVGEVAIGQALLERLTAASA